MSDSPLDLDLKFLPDWLKEPEGKNPYADFPGESADRYNRRDGRREGGNRPRSGQRPGGPGGPRSGPGGPRSGPGGGGSGPRSGGAARGPRPGDANRGPRPSGGGNRPFPNREGRRHDGGGEARSSAPRDPRQQLAEAVTIPLQVEFVPEKDAVGALIQQIKTSGRAFPLYGLGRMFLNKPERHRVRITTLAPACPIFRIGEDGPISMHRPSILREAFRVSRDQFYTKETTQSEAPKGNFRSVARCRLSGTLLGPTNHHGYQLALRRLYDARFSRRCDFQEFLRQIEIVTDPEAVEAWKAEVSNVTVFKTTQEEEPKEFKTLQEVEAHFQANYLEKVVISSTSVEVSGPASRNVEDRNLREAVRAAWEKERGFPAQLVNLIRPSFTNEGLQIWKHRKRLLYVSTVRPVRFGAEARHVSTEIGNLLNVIEAKPKCTRADLSTQLLKPFEGQEDFEKRKATLASDLRWLIQSGHVIEFHDGTFDLPLVPKEAAKEEAEANATQKPDSAPVAAETPEAEVEAAPVPTHESAPSSIAVEEEAAATATAQSEAPQEAKPEEA